MERIDALGIIAHHTHLLVLVGELEHDAVLGIVGVLILVHQHIAELRGILQTDVGMVLEQEEGMHQQVVEVHGIALPAALPITAVDVADGGHLRLHVRLLDGCIRGIGIGQYQVVLGIADAALHGARLVGLVVQLHFLDDALYQALGVRSVVDGEVGCEADGLCLHTENAREDGMEGTHPQVAGTLSHLAGDALLHLAGGLVGKGQRQDAPRLVALLHQIGYLVGKHTRLSRSCTCNDQRRTFIIKHSLTLAAVQLIQIVTHNLPFLFGYISSGLPRLPQ